MTSFKLVTPPAVEPVTLAEAKAHARIDTTADDALVAQLITGARQWAEKYTHRAFVTQTWQMALDLGLGANGGWWDGVKDGAITGLGGGRALCLPRAPLQSVTSVQYFDDGDNATTWPATNYYVDLLREPGRIVLRTGSVWPCPTRSANGIIVTYVAGYGSDGTNVPEPIKTAIRQLAAHWYEHRGESSAKTEVLSPPLLIQALLDPYRVRT